MSLSSFERYPLLFGPSPVHPLERLTAHLGGAALWAKREDCNSGIAYGGNKTRKLEYLVADALAQGFDTLVSIGGVQSNHTRQVAAVAARVGLKCVLVQESWVEWPDSVYDKVGNVLISRLAGAEVRLVRAGFGIGFKESWEQALRDVEAAGGKPYAIPAGASDHPLGGLGFARWACEVAEQERASGVFFDTVIVCSVTGSTQAGMVAGFRALQEAGGRPRRVLGIDASAEPARTREQIARIARATGRLIGVQGETTVELDERYHAGTYGIPDESTLEAMRLAARTEGMITDPVYEGKSMAGLIDLVRRGEIGAGSTVLYAHLGGQPALNAYSALFQAGPRRPVMTTAATVGATVSVQRSIRFGEGPRIARSIWMTQVRPMRADARRNYERLLKVAAEAFAEHGENASLDDIAKRAGVGSGTLYRHFPTRQDLLEAAYVDRMEAMAARADEFAAELPPGEALVEWLNELCAGTIEVRGMKALLGSAVTDGSAVAVTACGTCMKDAARRLVEAAQREGSLRKDIEPIDILRLAHGVASASELANGQGKQIRRYLSLLTEGLRP